VEKTESGKEMDRNVVEWESEQKNASGGQMNMEVE
jgi:hypothetical protein